jgi:serine/threonine protein kinase
MGIFASLKALFSKKKARPAIKRLGKKMPRVHIEKRFELISRIGQGSMSKVWRARDRNIGRTVCLKVLDKAKTAKFEERFAGMVKPTEGEILTQLKHKNVVSAFDHGFSTKGEQFIVMELIEGVGLNFLVETKAAQLKGKRIKYLVQLTEALDFVHRQKILHRDICPRNVMITSEDEVKLIDFGLSVPYTPEFCRPGNRTGTADYMAPEIIKRMSTDHRIDLFALGVTAYEMFTGVLPWEKVPDTSQTLLNHINAPGRDPLDVKPDLDKQTAQFLKKAIDREPNRRFQQALEFREALKALPKV